MNFEEFKENLRNDFQNCDIASSFLEWKYKRNVNKIIDALKETSINNDNKRLLE